jgi:hypothetical protein
MHHKYPAKPYGQITLVIAIIRELTSSTGKLSFLNTLDDALVFLSLENISQAVSLTPYLVRNFSYKECDSTLDWMPLANQLRRFGAKALKPPNTHAKLKSVSFRVARARLLP